MFNKKHKELMKTIENNDDTLLNKMEEMNNELKMNNELIGKMNQINETLLKNNDLLNEIKSNFELMNNHKPWYKRIFCFY